MSQYPNITAEGLPTRKYNCHSYAWYSQSQSNPYWMNSAASYINDGSYIKSNNATGHKVYYNKGEHSGIMRAGGKVISKWGQLGLYLHSLSDCPYSTATVTYWRYNNGLSIINE